MSYQPFALKYRPQRFEEIVGQPHVSQTLQNAVAQGRIVHGYLFAGPRGTGKTSTARVLAKALNCESGPTPQPCGECSICVAIQQGRSMDVIEIDAASNRGIDEIRILRDRVAYAPAESRYKVYILDEAHMLTRDAANAFLKTLEEPPPQSFFILATTEPHKIIPTIMSRCQRFDFRAIPVGLITQRLREIAADEEVQIDDAALEAIAIAADGAMRDGESILDQVIAYRGTDEPIDVGVVRTVLGITEEALLARTADLIGGGDVPGLFGVVDELVQGGKDLVQFVADLTDYFRNLLRLSMNAAVTGWVNLNESDLNQRHTQAQRLGSQQILAIIHGLGEARDKLRYSSQQSLIVEVTLAQLVPEGEAKSAAPPPVAVPQAPEPAAPEPLLQRPPEPAAPVAEGPLTVEAIQARWSELPVELKRSGNMPISAIAVAGSPVALDGETLVLDFDETHQFHCNRAHGEYREVIEAAIEKLFGQRLELACRLGGVEVAPEGEASPRAATRPGQPPGAGAVSDAVERTLQLFEGSEEIPEE